MKKSLCLYFFVLNHTDGKYRKKLTDGIYTKNGNEIQHAP